MLHALRTYRLLRVVLALVLTGGLAIPLAAPVCAAAVQHHDGMNHEAVGHEDVHQHTAHQHDVEHDHHPADHSCTCHAQNAGDAEPREATRPCCTIGQAPETAAPDLAALTSVPQVPTLTLLRLDVAPLPVMLVVPPRVSARDVPDPSDTGSVARHVFFESFLT